MKNCCLHDRHLVASFTGAGYGPRKDAVKATRFKKIAPTASATRTLHTVNLSRGLDTTFPLTMMLSAQSGSA